MINKRKVYRRVLKCWWETTFCLFVFVVVLGIIVFVSARVVPPHVMLEILASGLAMSCVMFVFSGMILRYVSGAKVATREEYPFLHEVVDEIMNETKWRFPPWMCRPTLYIMHIGDIPNAMAFGPGILWYAYVGITPMLYEMSTSPGGELFGRQLEASEIEFLRLNHPEILENEDLMTLYMKKRKLKGIIAHEIAHIRCGDVGLLSLITIVRGIVSSVSGTLGKTSGGTSAAAGVGMILKLIGDYILPLGTSAMQLVREVTADALGALYTGCPEPLMDGLRMLSDYGQKHGRNKPNRPEDFLKGLMISHPKTDHRIQFLEVLNS